MEKILTNIYFNPENPASFGGVNKLYKEAKNYTSKIKLSDVKNFLNKYDTYTLHKPTRRRYKTNKTIALAPDHMWQTDLTDMQRYATENDGFRYILFVIDVYTRQLFLKPLKSKHSSEVSKAFFEIITETNRFPAYVSSDFGKEYLGSEFQNMLKAFNIGYFTCNSPNKASLAERVQRTIKEKLFRYFTKFNTHRYINILEQFETAYNKSHHRMIATTPNKFYSNSIKMKDSTTTAMNIKPKFKKDAFVRISRVKENMTKGYAQGWTEEIFKINKVLTYKSSVPMYLLEDLQGEVLEGSFYEAEIQLVHYDPNAEFKIEKILGEKGKGKNRQLLVKWLGWPEKFASYINANTFKNL